jgi:hypothetical protein
MGPGYLRPAKKKYTPPPMLFHQTRRENRNFFAITVRLLFFHFFVCFQRKQAMIEKGRQGAAGWGTVGEVLFF